MRNVIFAALLFQACGVDARELCGTIAGHVVRFDSKYTFAPVAYVGVDYWGGEVYKNKLKGCRDEFRAVELVFAYPDFIAGGRNNFYLNPNRRTAALGVGEYRPTPTGSPPRMEQALMFHLSFGPSGGVIKGSGAEKVKDSIFNSRLSLHEVRLPSERIRVYRTVYWSPTIKAVDTVIVCKTYPSAQGTCTMSWVSKAYGVIFNGQFVRSRLGDWRMFKHRSEVLFSSFIVKNN